MNAQPKDSSTASSEQLASMTLIEHLTELRTRLIKSTAAVAVMGLAVFFLYPRFIGTLKDLLERSCPDTAECRVMATSPIQGLSTRMTASAYGGLGLALPFLMWQVWQFVTPGLYRKEKRLAAPFVLSSFLLFLMGTAIAWVTLPKAIYFLAQFSGDVDQFYAVNQYTQFVVKTAVGFGIGFQFPVLLVFLQIIGVLSPRQLGKWRRYSMVFIIVVASVITPGGDLFSLFALSVPMYLLYEVSILLGYIHQRRKRKRAVAAG